MRLSKKRVKKVLSTSDCFWVLWAICCKEKKIEFNLVKEFKFHPLRRWKFDFAIPELKVAVEIEGGVYTNGRHTRGVGYAKDCEKYNNATLEGWRLFRLTSNLCNKDSVDSIVKFCYESIKN